MTKNHSIPAISVRNVSAGYVGEIVIRDVSLEVVKGEVFAVMGRSGCGKTTLFRAMVGLLRPFSGEIYYGDEKMQPISERPQLHILRKLGVLFQSGALFSSMTVAENVALPLRQFTPLPQSVIEELVCLKLELVGLLDSARKLPVELSGGMQKRAALARAMALDPEILFFDEPSAGLDPLTSAELDETILSINSSMGTTIVVITHELRSVFTVADRAILLDPSEKTIIAEGPPEELRKNTSDPRIRDFFRGHVD
ncbi:MAG: ATP-binding cassette domain-containing protein [Deltaproteobacteria bacterium]|nr:ATP-binding cassette domain-containing protein [Deltaproteobacteria bacterium]